MTGGSMLHFGLFAGATFPTGALGDQAGTGFNVGGLVTYQSPDWPVSFRGDVAYHGFSGKNNSLAGTTVNYKPKIINGTANAVYMFSHDPAQSMHPYIIGGLGIYNLRASSSCSGTYCTDGTTDSGGSSTKFGVNGGGGVEFPLSGFAAFVEARYHHVFSAYDSNGSSGNKSSAGMIPLSFGIIFR
ncbi:MAG: outer membrane beta-barrel protein [Gemmatimonadaceae bacterium]